MSGGFYSGKGGKGSSKGGGGRGVAAAAEAGTIPGVLVRKLKALSYPEVDALSLTGQAYCKVVLWLEEEKIRLFEKNDRKALRDFSNAWYGHVIDYCKELGVNADGLDEKNIAAKLRVLNGLTNLAIHDIYRDKAEANEIVQAPPPKAVAAAGDVNAQKLQELIAPLNRLLESVSLPKLPADSADTDTLAALECIHARVCPPATKDVGTPLDLDQLPVGFHIADPEVKRAACVLRLLHGNELRDLQVRINQVINDLQKLTADPKTDSRLGRVGR
jgi:RLL motif-containing protein 1